MPAAYDEAKRFYEEQQQRLLEEGRRLDAMNQALAAFLPHVQDLPAHDRTPKILAFVQALDKGTNPIQVALELVGEAAARAIASALHLPWPVKGKEKDEKAATPEAVVREVARRTAERMTKKRS